MPTARCPTEPDRANHRGAAAADWSLPWGAASVGGVADVGEPALQHLVHRRRGEDRLGRCGELGGVEQERVGLGAAESAVGADLVLEGSDLFEVGVVAAVDHQVGDRRIAVDFGDLLAGSGTEWCQRILADHVAGRQIHAAAVPEYDG